jgi:hypothetical protein
VIELADGVTELDPMRLHQRLEYPEAPIVVPASRWASIKASPRRFSPGSALDYGHFLCTVQMN